MKNVVLIGAGGHGKVVIDIIEKEKAFSLLGLLDSRLTVDERLLTYQVLGSDTDLPTLYQQLNIYGAVVAIGDNWLRSEVVDRVRRTVPELIFVNCVHPSAQIASDVTIGAGNIIMAGCVVNSGTVIGNCCILNTGCSIDHDCVVGDYASFGPRSCAGGNVEVGSFSAVCLGANIIHRRKIGSHTVVGAGATVLTDLPSNIVAYGTPARQVRSRLPGDKYL
jgi:sugar O-acyltransferase (sialic acid O-acetyltransferase NeuD family)